MTGTWPNDLSNMSSSTAPDVAMTTYTDKVLHGCTETVYHTANIDLDTSDRSWTLFML